MDDAALAGRLIAGERLAAEEAWRRFAPVVRQTLQTRYSMLGDVDDLVQEVFLQFFHRVPSLRNRDALSPFVYSICLRTARWQVRRHNVRRRMTLTATGRVPDTQATEGDVDGRATLRRYVQIVDRLSERLRPLYLSRHVDGLELEEVAAAHAVSRSTARRRLQRAEALVAAAMQSDPLLAEWALAAAPRRRRSV